MTELIEDRIRRDEEQGRQERIQNALRGVKVKKVTQKDELLGDLMRYHDDKQKRVEAAEEYTQSVEMDIDEATDALQLASMVGDAAAATDAAARKDAAEKKLGYAREAEAAIRSSHVFPDAAIFTDEWDAITQKMAPAWEEAIMHVQDTAAAYRRAASELRALHTLLTGCRQAIISEAKKDGYDAPNFNPVLTVGVDAETLTVPRGETAGLAGMINPIAGGAL